MLLPSYCIAPDGTILWPAIMGCGCRCVRIIGSRPESSEIKILIDSCTKHYDKITHNPDLCNDYEFVNDEALILVRSDELN